METRAYAGAGAGSGAYITPNDMRADRAPTGPLVSDATESVRNATTRVYETHKRASAMADELFGIIPQNTNTAIGRDALGVQPPLPTRAQDLRGALDELHVALSLLDGVVARFGGI